jgi:hypothetical protein
VRTKAGCGISWEEYDRRLRAQNGVCAICRRRDKRRLAVDHDHGCCPTSETCGRCVRGLLCFDCNAKLPIVERYWEEALGYLGIRQGGGIVVGRDAELRLIAIVESSVHRLMRLEQNSIYGHGHKGGPRGAVERFTAQECRQPGRGWLWWLGQFYEKHEVRIVETLCISQIAANRYCRAQVRALQSRAEQPAAFWRDAERRLRHIVIGDIAETPASQSA